MWSTSEKCLSAVNTGKLCCLANAAIQISFSGIGLPLPINADLISPYVSDVLLSGDSTLQLSRKNRIREMCFSGSADR